MPRWAAAHPLRRAGLTPIETNLDKHLALVGLKDVRVVAYERRGPDVELVVEQIPAEVRCPRSAICPLQSAPLTRPITTGCRKSKET
jgi:hypothetical protein